MTIAQVFINKRFKCSASLKLMDVLEEVGKQALFGCITLKSEILSITIYESTKH